MNQSPPKRGKGFKSAGALLNRRIQAVSESRGFAISRLLTQWESIVGSDMADIARPVDIKYGAKSFGATLTVLTTGANAPQLAMQTETLRDKVNAVYGYNAISRVRVTQTAPTGFAEGKVAFRPAPKPNRTPDPVHRAAAKTLVRDVTDPGLRAALDRLAQNVLTKTK